MSDANSLDASPGSSSADETFALAVRSELSRRSLFLNDRGVTLSGGTIDWMIEGQSFSQPLARIAALHLEAQPSRSGVLPLCMLTFADASTLRVMACSNSGSANPEQTDLYRDFLDALHRRLNAADRARIDFTCGFSESRYGRVKIGMYLSGLLVLAALAAFLMTFQLKVLLYLAGGVAIFWRIKVAVDNNAPRTYDPEDIPLEMRG
jgi:hypothetical protein